MKNRIEHIPSGKEADEFALNHPYAQRFTIVEHPSGLARWLAWIKGKWVPVGPICPNRAMAQELLSFVARLATSDGKSMLTHIQEADRLMEQFGWDSARKMLGISDADWVACYKHEPPTVTEPIPSPVPIQINLNIPTNPN